jgi:hypothetical protein
MAGTPREVDPIRQDVFGKYFPALLLLGIAAANIYEGLPHALDCYFGCPNCAPLTYTPGASLSCSSPPFHPPIWSFVLADPLLCAALLIISVLVGVLAFQVTHRRMLLLFVPLLTLALLGFLSLFLFPFPASYYP